MKKYGGTTRLELESYILGALIKKWGKEPEQALTYFNQLNHQDFTGDNMKLFALMKKLFDKGEKGKRKVLSAAIGNDETLIAALKDANNPYSCYLETWVPTLKNYSGIDQYLECAEKAMVFANSNFRDPKARLEEIKEAMEPPAITGAILEGKTATDLMRDYVERQIKGEVAIPEKTGFPNLDALLENNSNGIPSGSILAILGATKNGKSALASSIFLNRCEKDTLSVLFSLEISSRDVFINMLAQHCGINRANIKKLEREEPSIFQFAEKHNHPDTFMVFDQPEITSNFIITHCRYLARQHKIKTIMIDYLTLLSDKRDPKLRADEHWANVSKRLRALAGELDCVIIVVTQANRNSASRADKRPQVNDIRESTGLQFDCYALIGTYIEQNRPDWFPKQLEANILLHRGGENSVVAYFDIEGGNLKPKSREYGQKEAELLDEYNKSRENFDTTMGFSSSRDSGVPPRIIEAYQNHKSSSNLNLTGSSDSQEVFNPNGHYGRPY